MFEGEIRGFSFNNGSFSDGKNDASTQVIDNVISGTLHGNYIYKSHVKFGPITQALEVSGSHVIGKGSIQSTKTFTPDLSQQGYLPQYQYANITYSKDLQDRVSFEGHAISKEMPANNSLLFTLQVGFRPKKIQEFHCAGTSGFANIRIQPNGKVLLVQRPNDIEINQGISLNGISLLATN